MRHLVRMVVVRVGSEAHPMQPEHYIEWVCVEPSFGSISCRLSPGDPPQAAP